MDGLGTIRKKRYLYGVDLEKGSNSTNNVCHLLMVMIVYEIQ